MLQGRASQSPESASRSWDKEKVQRAIKYFTDTTQVPTDDSAKMRGLIENFVGFEKVVSLGLVTADAKTFAVEFVKYGRGWLASQPTYRAVYQELGGSP